ncbi:MAG TPA: 50S ribosomal protein L25 [Candidatus Saccharimonadales bacterium]|nr:50S ribosomal protein L25 [Candidatus Saccharimonadales bacterium]
MEKIVLAAESRSQVGKKNRQLRDSGFVPAVMYGRAKPASSLRLVSKELEKVYASAGGNKIIGLKIDGGRSTNVLFQDVQHDSRTGAIIHADLYAVKMDEKIKTEVPLHFVGESTAVYQQEGTLLKNLEAVEVEALPGDLPESFEVDIAVLDDFDKVIHVSDLKIPEGVTLLTDPEELITKVEAPRSEEELAELEEAPVEELPEGVAEEQTAVKEENEGDMDQQPKGS